MDLHKFALGKCVAKLWKLRSKSGAKIVNATFAWAFLLTRSVLVLKGGIYHLCPTIYPSVVTFCAIYLQWPNLYQSFFDRLVLVCKHLTSRPCFEVKAIQFLRISMKRSSNSKQRETLLVFSTNMNVLSSTVYGLRRGAIGQFRIIY